MHRRSFLVRCSMAAVGTAVLPGLIQAAGAPPVRGLAPLTKVDRLLLRLLSAYSSDVYFWGGQVFARATGRGGQNSPTQVLVQVADHHLLVAFLRSEEEKALENVYVAGNTLSFVFKGTAYIVTNEGPEEFARLVASNVSGRRSGSGGAVLFKHETLLYHPSTGTLSDAHLALADRCVEFAELPVGNANAQFQALVRGWLASREYQLTLGQQFTAFQNGLLASAPTSKTAKKIATALLENIASLAAVFEVAALSPLLMSPLVSASLQSQLGLDAGKALVTVAGLRTQLAGDEYPDAALWLATLLGAQIQDGTLGEWIDLFSGDEAASAATRAALPAARRLVQV